jgi:hypothetical protein
MSQPARKPRDVRIDFFRGIAMFIILVAHIPNNPWARWIPARFGPSDAADIFVFCSGFASAIAFGAVFIRRGWMLGTARILLRFWQIYWAHLCLFVATATVCVLGTRLLGTGDYVGGLNLHHFFDDPMSGLVGLLTLTYVPNYFDILPMYMVALLLVPVVMGLRRLHLAAAIAFSLTLWASTKLLGLNFPAEWWSDRGWFFNPFAWQLVFFTGFAFAAGWIAPPRPRPWLIALAAAYVLVMIPLSHWPNASQVGLLREIREITWAWGFAKTDYGAFRWLHIMALGYLTLCLFDGRRQEVLRRPWAGPILVVGQNALAVFVVSMVAAQVLAMVLDVTGRTMATVALANLGGFALLIAVARVAAFFRSDPWRRQAPEAAAAPRPIEPALPAPGEARGRAAMPVN